MTGYKTQIEALDPGTAFVLVTRQFEIPYFRTMIGATSKHGTSYSVHEILRIHGVITGFRVLK